MTEYARLSTAVAHGDAAGVIPAWTAEALADVAGDRRGLRAVRHPLGFVCLPVERAGEYGVCVHLWDAAHTETDLSTSPMHAHSWELTSYVLYGEVRNELIALAEDEPTHRVFEVRSDAAGDEIRPTERLVRPYATDADVHHGGEVYRLPTGRFHTTTLPGGADAATVVLGRGRPGARDLSLGPVDMRPHRVTRSHGDRAETIGTARSALRALAGHGII